ncbi:uncharacterized protein LOC120414195 [Culex pipiens pallens]|uniref:uncharacterized protein LOC120414195 n=1 Tax=Culex pipiens pallens TaxID=42434 RepID=UPI001952A995|nr:uncharacterized protein LOC120414195 [Culex pipiens pallens]
MKGFKKEVLKNKKISDFFIKSGMNKVFVCDFVKLTLFFLVANPEQEEAVAAGIPLSVVSFGCEGRIRDPISGNNVQPTDSANDAERGQFDCSGTFSAGRHIASPRSKGPASRHAGKASGGGRTKKNTLHKEAAKNGAGAKDQNSRPDDAEPTTGQDHSSSDSFPSGTVNEVPVVHELEQTTEGDAGGTTSDGRHVASPRSKGPASRHAGEASGGGRTKTITLHKEAAKNGAGAKDQNSRPDEAEPTTGQDHSSSDLFPSGTVNEVPVVHGKH